MNHAQNLTFTWYISDLHISSVFLTWNLHSCPPMSARSALYAITGFQQLKTWFRIRISAMLHCLHSFCIVCVVLTWRMCEICVEYQRSFVKMLLLSRSSMTFHWRIADIWHMFRTCNTYVSLKIVNQRKWSNSWWTSMHNQILCMIHAFMY